MARRARWAFGLVVVMILQSSSAWAASAPRSTIADLSVSQTDSPDPVRAGARLTYSIAVRNLGPATATRVRLQDVLPAKANVVWIRSARGTCSGYDDVRCDFGTLTPSATTRVTIRVTPIWPGTMKNTATVTARQRDPAYANNSAMVSTIVDPPLVGLSTRINDSPDPVDVGAPLTYSIRVANFGPSEATGVEIGFEAFHPIQFAGLIYESGSTTDGRCAVDGPSVARRLFVSCRVDLLQAGSTTSIEVVLTPTWRTANEPILASVHAHANEPDSDRRDDRAQTKTSARTGYGPVLP